MVGRSAPAKLRSAAGLMWADSLAAAGTTAPSAARAKRGVPTSKHSPTVEAKATRRINAAR